MSIRTSPTGSARAAGFTLLELLVVIAIVALAAGAVSVYTRSATKSVGLRSAALETASRLRQTRASAINHRSSRAVLIDVGHRIIYSEDAGRPLAIGDGINMTITAAAGEQRSKQAFGIRFFPNGSSTGGTIRLSQGGRIYEIRVNWLTGRVSVSGAP